AELTIAPPQVVNRHAQPNRVDFWTSLDRRALFTARSKENADELRWVRLRICVNWDCGHSSKRLTGNSADPDTGALHLCAVQTGRTSLVSRQRGNGATENRPTARRNTGFVSRQRERLLSPVLNSHPTEAD